MFSCRRGSMRCSDYWVQGCNNLVSSLIILLSLLLRRAQQVFPILYYSLFGKDKQDMNVVRLCCTSCLVYCSVVVLAEDSVENYTICWIQSKGYQRWNGIQKNKKITLHIWIIYMPSGNAGYPVHSRFLPYSSQKIIKRFYRIYCTGVLYVGPLFYTQRTKKLILRKNYSSLLNEIEHYDLALLCVSVYLDRGWGRRFYYSCCQFGWW